MTQKNPEPEDDAALFRAAAGVVQPLAEHNRITPPTTPRKALRTPDIAAIKIADTLSDHHHTPPPGEFLTNGMSRMTLRKLRRATIQDTLDLHGLHSDAARRLLQEFLHHASMRQMRCVLVIHGKGLNSASGEAVLKIRTRHWLMQHAAVLAYCDAAPQDGGSGAVLILLRIKLP